MGPDRCVIAYGTYFFEMANIGKPFENSVILGAVGLVAIIVNTAIITKVGRRRVFICNGLLICAVSQLFTAVAYTKSPGTKATGQAIVGLAVLYLIGYNVRNPFHIVKVSPSRIDGLTKRITGYGGKLCVDVRRRAVYTAPPLPHFRSRHGHSLLLSVADNLYRAVFHQPRLA